MWKELCQTRLNTRTLLIDNEPKHSLGTQPPTGPVGQRPGRRPGEHVFSRVLDIFPSESVFASTLTYIFGPATHFGGHQEFSTLAKNLVHYLIILTCLYLYGTLHLHFISIHIFANFASSGLFGTPQCSQGCPSHPFGATPQASFGHTECTCKATRHHAQ